MFVVNDYLEIKDINIPHSYLDEFKETFDELLENYRDRLIDVSVIHAFNGVPVHDCDENVQQILSDLGAESMRWREVHQMGLLIRCLERRLTGFYSTTILSIKKLAMKTKPQP